jgi:hypothetical protein
MAPRRKIGPIERAVRKDLRAFPDAISSGGIAAAMIALGERADHGTSLEPRDQAQLIRELRLCMAQLRDMAPPGAEDDELDKLRKRRERRLAAGEY